MPSTSTAVRDRDRRAIAHGKPPCALCGGDIDYTLRYRNRDGTVNLDAFVVDHIIPTSKGGPDILANKQAAHARCNRAKSDTLAADAEPNLVEWETTRRWW